MRKKISQETIEEIVNLVEQRKSDSEIANTIGVSVSYVNKLRNKWVELKAKKDLEKQSSSKYSISRDILDARKDSEKERKDEENELKPKYSIVEDISTIDDIELIELKIKSLEKNIALYKELIAFKKEAMKK
jgi:ABC-type transporter lipoprotein component MlaA